MRVLVIGGTGTVGRETVRRLWRKGIDVRVLTRSEGGAGNLPSGVEAVVGDLGAPDTLPGALAGVDKVFMITPLSRNETELGLNGVRAAVDAGVAGLVYMTLHNLEEGEHIPHFGSKIPIVREIEGSGLAYTIVEPNNFFQNDLGLRDAIVGAGVYPVPLGGAGVSRVDVRDIADAVVNALSESGHEGERYPVSGPRPLTGEEVARIYGDALGREVRYAGDDLEAWAEAVGQAMPEWLIHDLRIMFEHFQEHGLVATEEDLEKERRILGHAPRSFEDFVAELAPGWRA